MPFIADVEFVKDTADITGQRFAPVDLYIANRNRRTVFGEDAGMRRAHARCAAGADCDTSIEIWRQLPASFDGQGYGSRRLRQPSSATFLDEAAAVNLGGRTARNLIDDLD